MRDLLRAGGRAHARGGPTRMRLRGRGHRDVSVRRGPAGQAVNGALAAAGVLMVVIAAAHTVIGERMIFRPWRAGNAGAEQLRRYRGILWATWHLASALGLGVGAVWLACALHGDGGASQGLIVRSLALATLAGAALVCAGTRGRHPGWIGLALAAAFAFIG